MLHASDTGSASHGAGYRLDAGGVLETYDDQLLVMNDAGRPTLEHVEGKWRNRGVVDGVSLGELKKLVAGSALEGRVETKTDGGKVFTLVTLRRGGAVFQSCYFGQQVPASVEALQSKVHDLVNRVPKAK